MNLSINMLKLTTLKYTNKTEEQLVNSNMCEELRKDVLRIW